MKISRKKQTQSSQVLILQGLSAEDEDAEKVPGKMGQVHGRADF